MKPIIRFLIPAAALATLATGCRTVPGTGRSQLNLVNESELETQSAAQFTEIKKQQAANNAAMLACLQRVGKRIVAEARKVDGALPTYEKWEFVVVKDGSANAFAMPGGKVAFNTGIFALMSSDDEVAVVMGHEVSHVIGRHGNERVSQELLTQFGGAALSIGVKDSQYASVIMAGYGAGAQYGAILPFSRKHESEADVLGIHLAAKAGYDPQVAIGFWEKMSAGGGAPPEFLSTHPSGATRIADLRKEMPAASAEYQKAKASGLPAGEKLNFTKAETTGVGTAAALKAASGLAAKKKKS